MARDTGDGTMEDAGVSYGTMRRVMEAAAELYCERESGNGAIEDVYLEEALESMAMPEEDRELVREAADEYLSEYGAPLSFHVYREGADGDYLRLPADHAMRSLFMAMRSGEDGDWDAYFGREEVDEAIVAADRAGRALRRRREALTRAGR